MPDLDLIKQAEQGDAGIRQGRCRRSSPGRRALQPTRPFCCWYAAEAV